MHTQVYCMPASVDDDDYRKPEGEHRDPAELGGEEAEQEYRRKHATYQQKLLHGPQGGDTLLDLCKRLAAPDAGNECGGDTACRRSEVLYRGLECRGHGRARTGAYAVAH